MSLSLINEFLAALPELARTAWSSVPGLEEKLAMLATASQAAWPNIELNLVEYMHYVAARCPAGQPPDPDFSHLNGPDLYLAAACVARSRTALVAFDRHYLRHVPNMLAYLKPSSDLVEEVQQQLRCRLLTAPSGEQPRLSEYAGRGALLMWLRSAAVRTALNILDRAENRNSVEWTEENDGLQRIEAKHGGGSTDVEQALTKERYREVVREAFLAALGGLPREQRNLLRLYYLDGRSMEEIGTIYKAHKATISRRMEEARIAVLDSVRGQLRNRLKVSVCEIDSLVKLIASQIDVSLSDVLRSSAEPHKC